MQSFIGTPNSGGDPHDAATAARHIAEAARELGGLAKRHRLDALGYLLDMTELEASQIAGLNPPSRK